MKRPALFLLFAGMLALVGCSAGPAIISDCQDERGIHPVCGFQNPEDLALLPDGHTLIVSEFGGGAMDGSGGGGLSFFDLDKELRRSVFPAADAQRAPSGDKAWSDPGCPGAPGDSFSPHGLDLDKRPDGRLRLLVVNHAGRESVELFELFTDAAAPRVEWRGCVLAPEEALFNDVVNLPDGGFLVTRMMDRDAALREMVRSTLGLATGRVYEWQPGRGFSEVAGTEGTMPNGIEVSLDGRELYLNLYGAGEVRRISRADGKLLARAAVPSPDNSTWALDGKLLVASHRGGLRDMYACFGLTSGACPMAFSIVALDPQTLESVAIFSNQGAPMGAGTVAVEHGDELVIGSFAADRLIRAPRGTGL